MLEKCITILIGYLDIIPMVLAGVILVALNIFIAGLMGKIVKFFLPKTMDIALKSFIPRVVKFFSFFIGCVATMGMVGMSTNSITATLGIGTIAIGMSLKDVFVNTIQGIMILVNHPFKPGDDITVSTASGKVIRIGLMYTRLDCGNGDFKLVPNNKMFNEIVTIKKIT